MTIRHLLGTRLFARSAQRERDRSVALVHEQLVAAARAPQLYETMNVPDTMDGRFSMMILHLWLLGQRLKDAGPEARSFSQSVFDSALTQIERSMRESGVGDLTIPKRLDKMSRLHYGHINAFDAALRAENPRAALCTTLAANLAEGVDAKRLADYTWQQVRHIEQLDPAVIVRGRAELFVRDAVLGEAA